MKDKYIILRESSVRTRGPVAGPAGGTGTRASLEIEVDELDRRSSRAVAAKKDVKAVAPIIPMKLISPVPRPEDTAQPAAGTAWGVTAVKADVSAFDGTDVAATEKKRAQELGYTVAEVLPYSAKTVDLSSLILRLKGAKVDVVLQTAYQNDAILYFSQARAAGFKPKVVIGAGGGYSLADTAKAVGADMNGVFDLDFPQSSINPAGAPGLDKFLAAYKATYKSDPQSGHSLTNYVGAKAFFEAIGNAKSTDKDKIREAVLAYKKPAGQTANGWAFDFGEDGQNNASTFYVMQWQDGKLVTSAPSNLALGKPIFKK